MSSNTIKILIADSQYLIAEACRSILDMDERYSVVGVVTNKLELLKKLEEIGNGILIIDVKLIDFESISDLKSLAFRFPDVKFLILTNLLSKNDFVELNINGFKNIIYKTADREELFSALDATIRGRKYYSPELLDLMMDLNFGKERIEESKALTSSELEVVKLISQGLTTKEIAARKNVSFHTINTHRKNIFRKMGVSNASELVMYAIKSGWIDTVEYYI